MKHKKSKGESAKTETNAAFTVCHCSFSAHRKLTHKHKLYTIMNPPNVNCLSLNDENSAVGGNVGTRACSLAMI